MPTDAPFSHILGDRTLVPVILGGDIGGYSIARAFDEAFGVKSIIASLTLNGMIRDSAIVTNVVDPGLDDPDVAIAVLNRIAREHPGATLLVLGSADWHVRTLIERRAELEPQYVVPYVSQELLDTVTNKDDFAQLCVEYGLAHPQTVVVDLAQGTQVDLGELRFPVIAKAGSTAAYHAVEFAGKEKVHTVASREDLDTLLAKVHASGYRDTFIIQDLIPGDDAGLRITNSYVDAQGKVCYTVFGHILLQEHTPSTVGNSSVVLTSQEPASVAALERLLEGIGWRGFGSFDMKVDPRTGEMVFFELNPRLSRSNYYVTGAGLNPAVAYVRDWVLNEPVVAEGESGNARPSLFMVVPRALMWRYLLDEDVKRQVRALRRKGAIVNPLWNRRERNLKRLAFVLANQANHFRKYRRFYPRNVQLAEREVAREAARKAQGQA